MINSSSALLFPRSKQKSSAEMYWFFLNKSLAWQGWKLMKGVFSAVMFIEYHFLITHSRMHDEGEGRAMCEGEVSAHHDHHVSWADHTQQDAWWNGRKVYVWRGQFLHTIFMVYHGLTTCSRMHNEGVVMSMCERQCQYSHVHLESWDDHT